jgi:hypothetical protein
MASGAQTPEGSIAQPTYHLVEYNLSSLRLSFTADLDYALEKLQPTPGTKLQAAPTEKLQAITVTDAFGAVVGGPGAVNPPVRYAAKPQVTTKTKHVRLVMAKFGPKGDPLAMQWGSSVLQPSIQEVVTLTVTT